MIRSIIEGFCIVLLAQGCIRNDPHKPEKININFVIDSFRIYPIRNLYFDKFVFSPIAEYNKIWTVNAGNTYELDLALGTWTRLSEKYDEDFKGGINESHIWKDSLTNEVFISLYPNTLLHFTPPKDTFVSYPIRQVTDVLNTKDTIVAGTPNGLYYIDKHSKNISTAPGFPFDIRVNEIDIYNQDTLLINHGGLFYPARLRQPGRMTKYEDPSLPIYNNPYIEMLPHDESESQYRILQDGPYQYYYSSNHFFYQDSSRELFEVVKRPQGFLQQIRTDDSYLYLLYTDSFVIINKRYTRRNATLFDLVAYQKVRKGFQEKLQRLYDSEVDSFLYYYTAIVDDSLLHANDELKRRFDNTVTGYLTFNLEIDNRSVVIETALLKNALPTDLEKYALVGLCMKYLKAYDLPKVETYGNRLNKDFPGFTYYGSQETLDCVLRIKHSVDSLKLLNMAKDEFIYKEALLKYKLIQCGWFGDNYYDFSIVNESYQKLLSLFPKSQFADNVELYYLEMGNYTDEGGEVYSEEQIDKCNKFIKKYPDSDLIPRVRIFIARNFNSYSGPVDSLIEMKEKALTELRKIDVMAISDTNMINTIKDLKVSIPAEIKQLCFQLKVIPKKTTFIFGEDLVFTAVLKNRTTKTRQLWLYSNDSYFGTWISPGHELTFIPKGEVTDTTMKLITILPLDSLVQEIILNKSVRHPISMEQGKYVFNVPGIYQISLHENKNVLQSAQAKFYMTK